MSIVWIVLPNGLQSRVLHASIFVSPRINGNTLVGTPFEDWPRTLASMNLRMFFDPSGSSVPVTVPALDSNLWKAVFGGATKVTPFTFKDNAARTMWSYPVSRTKAFIDSVYAAVQASGPTTYPSVDPEGGTTLGKAIVAVTRANGLRTTRARELYNTPRRSPTAANWAAAAHAEKSAIGSLSTTEQAIYLAKRFYDRPASSSVKDDQGNLIGRPRPAQPSFDFHQKLAVLADHPFLMRKLGLVIDVDLSVAAIQLTETGFVKAGAYDPNGGPLPDQISPRTQFELALNGIFRAMSPVGSTEVREGFVPVEDPGSYATLQGQPDGDVEKFVGFASNMALLTSKLTAEAQGTHTAPEPQPPPARRSAGFSVARVGRADMLDARFRASKNIDTGITMNSPADLNAEDLLRGFRVDVKTNSSDWFSLHKRRVAYSIGAFSFTTADEGYLKLASGSSDSSADGPSDLYVHEAMFGWEGWSLAVPRPGRRVLPQMGASGSSVTPVDDTPSPDFPLHAPVKLEPGSLIPLRFGFPYRFRVRAVDLAGNSLPPNAPDPVTPHTTAPQVYSRYEPIIPPTLVPRWVFTEGESVEHLVVRTGEGKGASDYALALNTAYADPAFPAKTYHATSERHVAPPKTTQAMAEAHGDFDSAFGTGADTKKFFRLGTREEGTFSDKRIVSLTTDDAYVGGDNPNQAAIITPPQVPLDQRRTGSGGPDVSSLTTNRGDALAPGEYVVCAASQALLPYLPDSAAGGVLFYDPASGAELLTIPFGPPASWPDFKPVRLQLAEGASLQVSSGPGVVTVELPPATILPVEMSSVPALERLKHFAYGREYGVSDADMLSGRHWMLTPRRQVLLVHAVPKPLEAPVGTFNISRSYESTSVEHFGRLKAHSRSTIHVDMEASWQETIDDPSRPLPDDGVSNPTQPRTGHAYQMPFTYGTDQVTLRIFHDLGDTRHRFLTYTPVAHTRYKEYFPPALVADASKVSLAGTAPSAAADGRFNVLSSSRPPAPKVLYVVPTFRWQAFAGTSVRQGGGLRIYLDRPWYASGEGELLAVVLASANTDAPIDRVSRWGRDPLVSDGVASALSAKNFVSPEATARDVQLGDESRLVDLVAYKVEFNAARRLWFCDVQLDPGTAYFPFVTLSLARYQPDSLKNRELSTPVRADFAQLANDRSLTFEFLGDAKTVRLQLKGVVSGNAADEVLSAIPMPPGQENSTRRTVPPTHRVVAYVQQRSPGSVGEMGWLPLGPETLLAGSRDAGGPMATWVADVPLTSAGAGVERRVVVEEREYYEADPNALLYTIRSFTQTDFRVVYLDTVPVP